MKRTCISELFALADTLGGETLCICGWIRSVRRQKNFAFMTVNDGSCFKDLQVVLEKDRLSDFEEISSLPLGSAVCVSGTLLLTPERPQPFELSAVSVSVEGLCAEGYPLQKQRQPREFLRSQQHLRSRTNLFRAVFRLRSVCALAIHRFFEKRGFVYVHTPIITASDAEGAGEMFRVTTLDPLAPPRTKDGGIDWSEDFFGKEAHLTVSGQLQAEYFALAFGKVYTFGPTFRAENSNTRRHAAEFWMVEPEIAFAELSDDMDLAEAMLKEVISSVMETCPDEMELFGRFVDRGLLERLNQVVSADFVRISYTEAIDILRAAVASGQEFEYAPVWGEDLQTEHERYLTEKHFGSPVFVTDYPAAIKAFYMRLNDDEKTVAAMDCLVPGVGEIIGGSQREERLEVLEKRIADLGMRAEDYRYYLDIRRFGGCKHAGFGLGFERLLMYISGVDNIRDVIPHPRCAGSADF